MKLYGSEPQMMKNYRNDRKVMDYIAKPTDAGVNELYNQATFFVQTSYHEGFCLPLLEAMAAGCPVICTDAHGNRDFSVDGKNCLMVKHDDPEDLKRQMVRILRDEKLRNALQKAGFDTVKAYRWPVIMERVEKFFEGVVAQPNQAYIKKVILRAKKDLEKAA